MQARPNSYDRYEESIEEKRKVMRKNKYPKKRLEKISESRSVAPSTQEAARRELDDQVNAPKPQKFDAPFWQRTHTGSSAKKKARSIG